MEYNLRLIVKEYLKSDFSEEEYKEALENATKKLEKILNMYGNHSLERTEPYYISQLIAESIKQDRISKYFKMRLNMGKECDTEVNAPSNKHPYCSIV